MPDATTAVTSREVAGAARPDVCYYHFPCLDGFGAALAVRLRWPDLELRPINYGQAYDFADCGGKHVLFVDFFPGAPAVVRLLEGGCKVSVLDHHKTAAADATALLEAGAIDGLFDMERSGAGIAWDVLHGGDRPRMIELLEDRDIWRWAHGADSRNFHAYIGSLPYDFGEWTDVMEAMQDQRLAANLLEQGRAIRRKHSKDIAEYIDQILQWWSWPKDTTRGHEPFRIATHPDRRPDGWGSWNESSVQWFVPVLNIPYTHGSEACHELLARFPAAPFAAYYVDAGTMRRWGFRSEDDRVDVSAVAKAWRGGGHRNASGCELPL